MEKDRKHNDIEKISYEIYRPSKDTKLSFVCYLGRKNYKTKKRESYHKEYRYTYRDKYSDVNRMSSVKIKNNSALLLEDKNSDWSNDQSSIMIGIKHMPRLIRGLREIVNWFYEIEDLFILDKDEKLHFNKKYGKEINKKIRHFPKNRLLAFKPTVIIRDDDIEYEGVIMYMNTNSSRHFLTLDEVEALLYTIENFDMFQSAQLALNYIQRPDFGEYEIDMDNKNNDKPKPNSVSTKVKERKINVKKPSKGKILDNL